MNRWPIPAVLVAVVVLAGCVGVPGTGTTPTGTPNPTVDRTPTPPPGVTGTPAGTDPPDAPYLVFANDRAETYEVTVYLTAGATDRFRATFSNGTTKVYDQPRIPGHAVDVEPATEPLATETYRVEGDANLFLTLRGCEEDTRVWYKYAQAGTSNLGYGAARPCAGYTELLFLTPNGGGSAEGGDYRGVLDESGTVVRTLAAD